MRRAVKWIGLILLIGIAGAGGYVGYHYYQKYQLVTHNPDIITKEETAWLVEQVSKLMDLPTDETPTIATVLDKDKLKDQQFFNRAENGDKVLVYMKAKKAILFRPNTDKIIEVGPVSMDQNQTGVSGNVKVAIYNGTSQNTDSALSSVETKLKDKITNLEVVSKTNAKANYTKTLVIDLSGSNPDKAKGVADAIDADIGQLPSGESKPDNADVLVIFGG
jgi:hypothetical protein